MHLQTDIITMTLLTIMLFIGLLSSAIVTLSYLFYWYELANSQPKLIKIRFRGTRINRALLLLLTEFLANFLSWLSYPFGWVPLSTFCFRKQPKQTIILLHGLYQNRSCFYWLQFRLALHGYRVISLTLPPWKDIESLTEQLDQQITTLRQSKNIQKVNLIGHSFGGLIARNYIQRRGGSSHINQCITIGTPHYGSKLAPFAMTALALNIVPRCSFLNQLNRLTWPKEITFTSLYSDTDNLILPTISGFHPQASNLSITRCGHMSLLYHLHVFNTLLTILKKSDLTKKCH